MKKGGSGSPTDPRDERVRLQPIFGIRPGIYLSVLYAVLIMAFLFLVLVLPGIVRHGTVLTVDSSPPGASVFVDGKLIGATPISTFVPSGEREIVVGKPYFSEDRRVLRVRGRLLGSYIVPRRERIRAELNPTEPLELLREASRQHAAWALAGPVTERYPKPQVLSTAVRDLLVSLDHEQTDRNNYANMSDFLYAAAKNTASPEGAADLLRASALLSSGGGAANPAALLDLVYKFIQFQGDSRYAGFWLLAVLPEEARAEYLASPWYAAYLRRYDEAVERTAEEDTAAENAAVRERPDTVLIDGVFRFQRIPGGRFLFGRNDRENGAAEARAVPYPVTLETFYIMDREVTRRMYSRFLTDRPQWNPANRERLAAEGLADAGYLTDWDEPAEAAANDADRPVRFVSWHAAAAFSAWLEERLPPSLAGYSVRLPTEAEWEYAARGAESHGTGRNVFRDASLDGPLPVRDNSTENGLYDMLGNLWEWTDDWFSPASYLFLSGEAASESSANYRFPGAERVVKGGSWANTGESISPIVGGSQPPEWCTAFLGFRPVIVRE